MQKKYRFNLRLKLVLFTTILAIITYASSAAFIYFFQDIIQSYIAISENIYIIIILGLGVFWSGVLAYFAARVITKPLQDLEKVASEAAKGNLNQLIATPKTNDEIGSLTIAITVMLGNLKTMVHNIESHFDHTKQMIAQMRESSKQSAEYSVQINVTTDDIARGAESSANAIQETAASVAEAMDFAEEVQTKAKDSQVKSAEMLQLLDQNKTNVHNLVNGIQVIANDQTESLKDVNELNEHASQIESIITMVGDIADQTNLLALNASIEAARAGENGKGFAVVAEEIRGLADQSRDAVQRVSKLITTIQDGVNKVVYHINDQVADANKEVEKGLATNESIQTMSHSVTEVASEVKAITELVNQQLISIQSTVKQSQEVAAIAEETSAASEEVSASIQEQTATITKVDELTRNLEGQAEDLNRQINQFSV